MVGSMNRIAAIAAGAVALTLVIVWLLRRRKSNA
jgi:LPXTG-motif cell wall-anchored protein